MLEEKQCRTCAEIKSLNEFYKRKNRPSYDLNCNSCNAKKMALYRKSNPQYVEKMKQHNKEKYWTQREIQLIELKNKIGKIKICSTCGYEGPIEKFKKDSSVVNSESKNRLRGTCKICHNQKQKLWREKNPDKIKLSNKKTYDRRKSDINFMQQKKLMDKHLYQNNESYRRKKRIREKNRAKNSPISLWRRLLKNSLTQLSQKKKTSTQKQLGYVSHQLFDAIGHKPAENYALDHKIPLSWLESNTPTHIACDIRNLHWITNEENQRKNNWYADAIVKDFYVNISEFIKEKYKKRFIEINGLFYDKQKDYILKCWSENKSCL